MTNFGSKAAAIRKDAVDATMDADLGKARGKAGRDMAADSHSDFVMIARRIAREKAANGPITIDDVTEAMARDYNVLSQHGVQKHKWKGAVFATSEWAVVGSTASRDVKAHGRPVKLWARKDWLRKNSMNGRRSTSSAFVVSAIYKDFQRSNPGLLPQQCHWTIGLSSLSKDITDMIQSDGNKLYGIPVTLKVGTVGAVLEIAQQ